MGKLIENLRSNIDRNFITLYDFIINFSEYNNDSLNNVGIFLSNIGFGSFNNIFGNKDYDIYLYEVGVDYTMHSIQYIDSRFDPMPKIIQQVKDGEIDKELTTKMYLRKMELIKTFNKGDFIGFLMMDEKTRDTTDNKKITLQTQLDQANARIAELERMVEQSKTATAPIFDSQDGYTYPPELDMAIKIWIEIYQTDNIPKHLNNHSDKFTQACKNLGFSFTENAVKTRLKKVTTPQSQKEKTKNKNSLK